MWPPSRGDPAAGCSPTDGYIAGVCNFAEPQGNHGLYATPRSIYTLLDRNNLTALYAPATRGSSGLLADGRPGSRPRRGEPVSVARSQSPDNEEQDKGRGSDGNVDVMIPPPNLLGIVDPVSTGVDRSAQAASGTTRRTAWHPTRDGSARSQMPRTAKTEQTDLNLDSAADHDRFSRLPDQPHTKEAGSSNTDCPNPPSNPQPSSGSPSKSRWKAVTAVRSSPGSGTAPN